MPDIVISRYFARQYMSDALPPHTRVETEPAHIVLLRLKKQREEKRAKRKATSSPLSAPSAEKVARPTPSDTVSS